MKRLLGILIFSLCVLGMRGITEAGSPLTMCPSGNTLCGNVCCIGTSCDGCPNKVVPTHSQLVYVLDAPAVTFFCPTDSPLTPLSGVASANAWYTCGTAIYPSNPIQTLETTEDVVYAIQEGAVFSCQAPETPQRAPNTPDGYYTCATPLSSLEEKKNIPTKVPSEAITPSAGPSASPAGKL